MKYSPEQKIDSLSHQLKQTIEKTPIYPSPEPKKTPFISRVERFASQERMNPGPGSYEPSLPDKHTGDFRSSKVNEKQRGDFPLQHAWINGSNRHSFMLPKAAQSGLGPGEYN